MRKLAQADRMLGEGKDVADVCRELQIAEQTYYRWRNQFGGLKADDAKRLKDLERENATLKRLLADAEREQVLARSATVYGGYAKYKERITSRKLRIFVLEATPVDPA